MPRPIVSALRENMWRALSEARLNDAAEILTHLKQEDPLTVETRGFELELLLNANRLPEAMALAAQLRRLFPESGRIAFLAGKAAYKSRNYDEAAAHFRESNRIYPHWRTQFWLGKTLTQSGQFAEAEGLLRSARDRNPGAVLELAWLYERKNDLTEALRAYDEFLTIQPGHAFATEQRIRVKARLLDPEALIEEIQSLTELGEDVPAPLFPDYLKRLFESGQTVQARNEITSRINDFDPKTGPQVAWVCYRAQAYDLACTLFLAHLRTNLTYFKFLNALESAALKCGRVSQVLEAYKQFAEQAPSLHGRSKSLLRRSGSRQSR